MSYEINIISNRLTPLNENRYINNLMSRHSNPVSPSAPDMPPIYSRNSLNTQTSNKSQSGSGRVGVLMDVSNNWSPHSAPGALLNDKPSSNFWRKTMALVMMPFVLTGAPVFSAITELNSEYIDSTVKWLKYIFWKRNVLPLNLLAAIIAIVLNLWLTVLFGDLLIKIYIFGEIPNYLMSTIYDLIELLPVILAVDLFWFKGYVMRDVIYKLDTISLNSEQPTKVAVVIKLVIIYSMCFILHIIHFFTYQWRFRFNYSAQTPGEYFRHLPFRIINTFLIPVYITFLFAIQMRFRRMNVYIKQLIANIERPDSSHLREIKFEYKNNGLIIGRMNSAFNIVMSAFFAVLLAGIAMDSTFISYSVLAFFSFNKGLAEESPDEKSREHLKELVRCIAADVAVIGMKGALIALTVMQIVKVNHESRGSPIHLSDFFSQTQNLMQTELYQSFRSLHIYMKSRLEKTDRPSLVRNTLLSNIPYIRSMLTSPQ